MEADFPDRVLGANAASGSGSTRPRFRCRECGFVVDRTLGDGSCPSCAGVLEVLPPAAAGAAPAPPVPELDDEENSIAALLTHLAETFLAAGVHAADADVGGASVPADVLDALPRVTMEPYCEIRCYVVPDEGDGAGDGGDDEAAASAAVARIRQLGIEPSLVARGTAAAFGPPLSGLPYGLAGFVAACDPADGSEVRNGAALAGRLALLARGGPSFALKVGAVQRARARGALISQSAGAKWPFTMADSKGDGADVSIPSAMVPADAGAQLRALLDAAPGGRVLAHVTCKHAHSTCAVCLEEFIVGTLACQLPCSHCFHDGCISRWLTRHVRCPVCRAPITAAGAPAGAGDGDHPAAASESAMRASAMFS